MARFFVESVAGDSHVLTGADAAHAAKSLRMRAGERLTLCDTAQMEYDCVIRSVEEGAVLLDVTDKHPSVAEPGLRITLYQGLPKGDKMDLIVQKAVELGVFRVVPTLCARCVSRPDAKSLRKKRERWQKIAEEAAKQSGRGRIPEVGEALELQEALAEAAGEDLLLLCYEGGGRKISALLPAGARSAAVFIGPEGGFEPVEAEAALRAGGCHATLGARILRTETAPLAALTALLCAAGEL